MVVVALSSTLLSSSFTLHTTNNNKHDVIIFHHHHIIITIFLIYYYYTYSTTPHYYQQYPPRSPLANALDQNHHPEQTQRPTEKETAKGPCHATIWTIMWKRGLLCRSATKRNVLRGDIDLRGCRSMGRLQQKRFFCR